MKNKNEHFMMDTQISTSWGGGHLHWRRHTTHNHCRCFCDRRRLNISNTVFTCAGAGRAFHRLCNATFSQAPRVLLPPLSSLSAATCSSWLSGEALTGFPLNKLSRLRVAFVLGCLFSPRAFNQRLRHYYITAWLHSGPLIVTLNLA